MRSTHVHNTCRIFYRLCYYSSLMHPHPPSLSFLGVRLGLKRWNTHSRPHSSVSVHHERCFFYFTAQFQFYVQLNFSFNFYFVLIALRIFPCRQCDRWNHKFSEHNKWNRLSDIFCSFLLNLSQCKLRQQNENRNKRAKRVGIEATEFAAWYWLSMVQNAPVYRNLVQW